MKSAVVVGPRTVRFDFTRASAELPLLVGGLPVFSREWGAGKPFDQVITDMPIGSGPYRIGRWNSATTSPTSAIPTTGRATSACAAACTTSTA